MNESRQPQPLFVLGSPRSGTTLLAGILNRFSGVHIARETQFIPDLFTPDMNKLESWCDSRLNVLLEEINAYLVLNRWPRRADTGELRRFLAQCPFRNYAGLIAYVWQLDAGQEFSLLRYIGDNSPRYIMAIPLLEQLFPDARYLHIVRDGRDVICSILDKKFGGNSALVAARAWMEHVACWQFAERTIAPERRLQIRYEDLVAAPDDVRSRLGGFLGIQQADEGALSTHDAFDFADAVPHHSRLKRPIDASAVGRFKRELSPSQQKTIEALLYPALVAYGYDVGSYRPSPTMLERNVVITGSHLLDLSRRLLRRVPGCR